MNRRSLLRLLGLAPIAAPAVVVAAQASAPGMTVIDRRVGAPGFTFDAETGTFRITALSIQHPSLPAGHGYVTGEQSARVSADTEAASFIGSVISRPL